MSSHNRGLAAQFSDEEMYLYVALGRLLRRRDPDYRTKVRNQQRARYAKDPARYRRYALDYAKRNPEKVKAHIRAWKLKNREHCAKYKAQLMRTRPEYYAKHCARSSVSAFKRRWGAQFFKTAMLLRKLKRKVKDCEKREG